jgi:Outer membrane protein beta-barrel domain
MKSLLLVGALCVSAAVLHAQKVAFGITGGTTINTFDTRFTPPDGTPFGLNWVPSVGWRVAVPVEWQVVRALALRAEVGVQQRAAHLDVTYTDENGNADAQGSLRDAFTSFDAAVLVKMAPLTRVRNLYLLAGGSYSHIDQYRVVTRRGADVTRQDGPLENIELRQTFLELGLGWQKSVSPRGRFIAEARYQRGLNDWLFVPNAWQRSRTLALSVGYLRSL